VSNRMTMSSLTDVRADYPPDFLLASVFSSLDMTS
jgi:hypothetical protein